MRTIKHNGFVSLMAMPVLALVLLIATDGAESGTKETERQPQAVDKENVDEPKRIEVGPTYSAEELEMLACVIYQEAGGDACCDDCRRRVADVVLNRVADERFPDTLAAVLTQKQQYGRFYWTGIVWPDRSAYPEEANAVERAYRVAREALEGHHSALYGKGYIWQAEFSQGVDTIECCGIFYGR